MTKWGGKLAGVDEEQLRQQLRTESDGKAIKRLTSAVLYKQGYSPVEIERLLGFLEQTVYDWLDTVAERDLTALRDLPRPGQSTRLTDDQWRTLTATLAGTGQYSTPHAHIYVRAEGDVPRGAFQPVVQRFVGSCEYAPADGRANSTESDTISIRGTEQTDTIPRTEDGGSAGATYVLTQLAHLPEVDSMDFDELLWASTVRASEGIHHFRKSGYVVWGEGKEPEPEEAVEDLPTNTVLSRPVVNLHRV